MQQRQTTTKSDIKEAFIQLLATKSLEDITISQLTKKAGVNRSTFYLHYLDK
jgi:AcrR family transcriptional regulator